MKSEHKGHKEIAEFSPQQQAMFFAVSAALGYKPEDVKERAKERFKVDCFNKLKISDMSYMIDRLVQQQFKRSK